MSHRTIAVQHSAERGDAAAAEKDFRQALSIFPTYQLAKDGLKRVKV